jgi:hypothetical protein
MKYLEIHLPTTAKAFIKRAMGKAFLLFHKHYISLQFLLKVKREELFNHVWNSLSLFIVILNILSLFGPKANYFLTQKIIETYEEYSLQKRRFTNTETV